MLSPAIICLYCCLVTSLSYTTIISLLFRGWFIISADVYKRLGQFDYGQPSCTTHHIKTCIDDNCYIYIGEVKEGTDDTPHGIGIKVYNWGNISEGYWKDGKLNGRGRDIYGSGDYYIGEVKEGYKNGEGTCYRENGDKCTGQWHDWEGQGEINYKDGTKYIGQWDGYGDSKRYGVGTLYSADGQVLNQGKWENDKYMGKE